MAITTFSTDFNSHICGTIVSRSAMLVAILILACAPTWVLGQSAKPPKFPYQAIVSKQNTVVRSGPAGTFYGTDRLQPGDTVQVYRHDPSGWLAIRPVEGSFSMVPESNIEMVREGVGRIRSDKTLAWVGTRLGPVEKPQWQIKLRKNEEVAVIGELPYPHPEGHSTIWYQIEPPAGEFRWIHRDNLEAMTAPVPKPEFQGANSSSRQTQSVAQAVYPENDSASKRAKKLDPFVDGGMVIGSGLKAQSQNHHAEAALVSHEENVVEPGQVQQRASNRMLSRRYTNPASRPANHQGWRKSTRPIEKFEMAARENHPANRSLDGFQSNQLNNPSQSSGFQSTAPPFNRFASRDASRSSMASQLNSNQFNAAQQSQAGQTTFAVPVSVEARAIEDRLTQELLKQDPSQWQLDPIEKAAYQFQQTAFTNEQRAASDRILNKLQNCRRLQTGFGNRPVVRAFNLTPSQTKKAVAPLDRTDFDAVGWLNELKRQNGTQASSYVLQDANGKITHRLAPIVGVNLNRYLKTKVGVMGQRGFDQNLQLPYVQVQRVYTMKQ